MDVIAFVTACVISEMYNCMVSKALGSKIFKPSKYPSLYTFTKDAKDTCASCLERVWIKKQHCLLYA